MKKDKLEKIIERQNRIIDALSHKLSDAIAIIGTYRSKIIEQEKTIKLLEDKLITMEGNKQIDNHY